MDIVKAVRNDTGKGVRRLSWPKDWCIKPTNNELCCAIFSKNKSAPRWEPTKDDITANDWEIC